MIYLNCTNNRNKRLQMKFLNVVTYTFAIGLLVSFSEPIIARDINNSLNKVSFRDTLNNISGKIVDSLTNEPIPFATITFIKENADDTTIVSNNYGEFLIDAKYVNLKVRLSAIGYQQHTYSLSFNHDYLLSLSPATNILPNVIVSGSGKKKRNAVGIMKKVNKHIGQNYGDISFDQKCIAHEITQNYDTIKSKMTEQFIMRYNRELKSITQIKRVVDTTIFDTYFSTILRLPNLVLGDIIPRADILRQEFFIGEKQIKNFDFRLLSHYQDKTYGLVYRVSFKPYSTNTYNDLILRGIIKMNKPLGFLKGEMLIREEDYAVVSINYSIEMNVEQFNAAIEKAYHSRNWNEHIIGKIISNSRRYDYEYVYKKDTINGKYFVQSIKTSCSDIGYQIENHRNVLLNYQFDTTSLGVENIVE